ncbi:DNA replication licensing factor mcm10 [Psilocybe cubensis]|uniref:DNA replication licensing factor mcm10 n=2 Tax=Psilocybe cubensis TaxID=181762 RepID=A0ACB8GNG0_PSICU|nr:DNA replication licensing factor mcm10 [Psilocybe cubensis]KAH9477114.1 DNA replication licensing factor mcm10 [Psilocybe cubensis]
MNSSTSRNAAKKQTQEEIKRQIALLQACLEPESESETTPMVRSPKRKSVDQPVTLAPATPSPKKKRKTDDRCLGKPIARPVFHSTSPNISRLVASSSKPPQQFTKLAPSNIINKLASITQKGDGEDAPEAHPRSAAFTDRPVKPSPVDHEIHGHKRDERLALIENIEPGPYQHTPPTDDPNFEKLEPHSGIAMVSRTIPHEEFNDHLAGRYYLSPSRLYSSIRLLPDKQGYDVSVPGDWITIAVVAERGPIKFTRAPVAIERESGDPDANKKHWKGKNRDNEPEKPGGKKFVNLKLVDFGARSGSTSSATGRTPTIRGDAFLTLLLFEADGFDLIPRDDGRKPEKIYKGGSRGAFEHLTNVKEGDVIALLNPRILKPFQRSNDSPHPVNNILALTPESASSIMVLGRARDLGMCTVRKQDGKICGSWCDKRLSEVCDYHVQNAVQRRRAARPEFSVGTSGMSTSATHKSKNAYDPLRKWGLKPSDEVSGNGATYMVAGHVVSGSSADPRTMFVGETIGREGQARAKRIMDNKDSDRALKALLQRDKEGMKAVMKAREVNRQLTKSGKDNKSVGTTTKKRKKDQEGSDEEDQGGQSDTKIDNLRKTAYSAGIIKSLGFDPSLKPGQRRVETKGVQQKLETLEALLQGRKDIALGPKPGPRIRSGVTAPKRDKVAPEEPREQMCDLDSDSNDELPEKMTLAPKAIDKNEPETKMVDLDDF